MFSPQFTITNKILTEVGKINAARAIIENATLLPSYERKFQRENVVRTAHFATKIEGNPLSQRDAKRVIEGKYSGSARKRDVQEVINYRRVVEFIDQEYRRSGRRQLVGEQDLLNLHAVVVATLVPKGEAGRYRKVTVTLRSSASGKISFAPPPYGVVPGQVKSFFKWLGSRAGRELHPILRAGLIIAEVTRIHPFTEGNGRAARALATLSLYLDGYDVKRFFCFDEYYDRSRKAYYKAIQTYRTVADDLTPWLEFFVEGLAVELRLVEGRVRKLSRHTRVEEQVAQIELSERQEVLVEFLQDYGKLTNADFERIFPDISEDTVLRELKGLIRKKVIRKRGRTKGAYYELRPQSANSSV